MNKKVLISVLIFLWTLFSSFVYAEIYQYRDSAGAIRFTDDLSKVPSDQRSQIESFKEIVSKETDTIHDNEEIKIHEEQIEESDFSATESEDLSDLKKINEQKAKLDKEYAELVSEKEAVLKMKKAADTQEAKKVCNEKTVQLNERIAQYETRRQAFSQEAEKFNKRFK